jgi:hypothetical protein
LLSINSGLLFKVAIDEAVFLRSVDGGNGGDVTDSFPDDAFRDSHEKGLVSFLLGGAGFGDFENAGGGGGAPHGTDGSAPESPMSADFTGAFGGSGGFLSLSVNNILH